ncbi:hypothetical protein [Paenibacillus sp. 1P03SA]|uniref:hypothetical protein n=1 Tax=Paenibacillus sp. 1P03SA TaxID=3132294 RepID=UPI0039A004AE
MRLYNDLRRAVATAYMSGVCIGSLIWFLLALFRGDWINLIWWFVVSAIFLAGIPLAYYYWIKFMKLN